MTGNGKRAETTHTKHPPLRKNMEKIPQTVGKTGDDTIKLKKIILINKRKKLKNSGAKYEYFKNNKCRGRINEPGSCTARLRTAERERKKTKQLF